MARGRPKTSPIEDLLEAVTLLPWWGGVLLALVSYIGLHAIAGQAPLTFTGQPGQMGSAIASMVFQVLASYGQYLLPLLCLVGAALSALGRAKRKQLLTGVADSTSASALNELSWHEFELLVGEAFRRQGFAVTELGGGGADGGVDLVLSKGREKFLVQCKQWRAQKVGVGVVRELYGVMAAQGAAGGYVITSGQFTQEARDFASGRNLNLIDGPALHALIADLPRKASATAARPSSTVAVPPAAEDAAPPCPKCSTPMAKRVAKQGASAGKPFWGCPRFPACRGTRGI